MDVRRSVSRMAMVKFRRRKKRGIFTFPSIPIILANDSNNDIIFIFDKNVNRTDFHLPRISRGVRKLIF